MYRLLLLSVILLFSLISLAQITNTPEFPTATQNITIIFNSGEESRLGYFSGDLYAHTGVTIEGKGLWQNVIGNWKDNSTQPQLSNKGNGIYELKITPSINSFYNIANGEKITQLCLVFRSKDGSKQTNDLFIDVYENNFSVAISSHNDHQIIKRSTTNTIKANCSTEAELSLQLDNTILETATGTSISKEYTFEESGWHWLIAHASSETSTTSDSVYIYVTPNITEEIKPQEYASGINYLSDDSVALVLWAPEKEFVFVIGDFNNWQPNSNYLMKKDGDYFWLKIGNLTAKKEYIFQYLVDGNIRIGDPYCDKVSDPYDDQYISANIYPDLPDYPEAYTQGRASVLQTAQPEYSWTTTSFDVPENEKLVIYELLIRDFTSSGSYKAIIDKLNYLQKLGINTIELMPFNEFEGNSSWGYNPNYFFAPDKAYGSKNDLKALIDSCHQRGLLVIQDIVLNHAYNSSPMVKMYWDKINNRPADNNPWFNTTSPNTAYSWGSDFNHESTATQNFIDSVTTYWMTQYHIDGFRFDFTKGFTNTAGDGSAYDASRIAILKRMANHIWNVKPEAKIILEHFAANTEEKELTSYGMMVWGNGNHNFNEATMGYTENNKSDLSWSSYQKRGFTKPGLVAYMESHDEERLMYKNLTYGNSSGNYNITELSTALDRCELAATFLFSLTGPKMIWQFGELGYDYSIDENGRTGEKPIRWDYEENADRKNLFNVYSAMLNLRNQFDVFTSGTETLDLEKTTKSILLTRNDTDIVVIGNFGLETTDASITFPSTGIWNEFFTDNTLSLSATTATITLAPGEYRLYSNIDLPSFKEIINTTNAHLETKNIKIYPNPVSSTLFISSSKTIKRVEIYSINGILLQVDSNAKKQKKINLSRLHSGVYFIRIFQDDEIVTRKILVQ